MTETSTLMKYVFGGGAILALVTPFFIGGQYVSDLRHEIDASKGEIQNLRGQVVQLQEILKASQSSASSGTRGLQGPKGEKGDQGDVGPQGPRGERGPPGEPGNGPDAEYLRRVIDEVVAQRIKGIPAQLPVKAVPSSSPPSSDTSKCLLDSETRNSDLLVVKKGVEICDGSGRLLTRVDGLKLNNSGWVHFFNPDGGSWYCVPGNRCQFKWDNKRSFVVERTSGEGDRATIYLRFTDRS